LNFAKQLHQQDLSDLHPTHLSFIIFILFGPAISSFLALALAEAYICCIFGFVWSFGRRSILGAHEGREVWKRKAKKEVKAHEIGCTLVFFYDMLLEANILV
jgi:hypothetical protein